MERYENLFAQLKDRKEGAFVPFVTLGDPSVEQSLKIIDTLVPTRLNSAFRSPIRWPMAQPFRKPPCVRLPPASHHRNALRCWR